MTAVIQRPLKGSRISSFYPVKTLPPISALDSAFQLQEYISLLIRLDVHDVEKIVSIPGKDQNEPADGSTAKGDEKETDKDAAGGVNVDPACWVYEHLRRVAQDLSHPLITMLQQECTRTSCPEMKAGEWLYLCVAHGNEGAMEQCCAIDYILHTLDSATALLNSPRAFPSRYVACSQTSVTDPPPTIISCSRLSVPATSHRHFTSLCRRLGRIFAHAYFHHREVFEQAEAESSLYARFLALVKYFDLVPLEFLVIPPRMEGGRIPEPVEPPRLMGASLEPRKALSASSDNSNGGNGNGSASWPDSQDGNGNDGAPRTDREKSPPGPAGQARNPSPRKFGRPRTDTMVYSEAYSVAEELAKSDMSDVDMDREVANERAAAVAGAYSDTSARKLYFINDPAPSAPVEQEATQAAPPDVASAQTPGEGKTDEKEKEAEAQPAQEPPAEAATSEPSTESAENAESAPAPPATSETPSQEPAETPVEIPTPAAATEEVPPTTAAEPSEEKEQEKVEPPTETSETKEGSEPERSEPAQPPTDEPNPAPAETTEESHAGEDKATHESVDEEETAPAAPEEPAPAPAGSEAEPPSAEEPNKAEAPEAETKAEPKETSESSETADVTSDAAVAPATEGEPTPAPAPASTADAEATPEESKEEAQAEKEEPKPESAAAEPEAAAKEPVAHSAESS
ncbi:Mob1/phocein [Trametes polyzona]|nr:Mob1/phocein [Trametes polyzona]